MRHVEFWYYWRLMTSIARVFLYESWLSFLFWESLLHDTRLYIFLITRTRNVRIPHNIHLVAKELMLKFYRCSPWKRQFVFTCTYETKGNDNTMTCDYIIPVINTHQTVHCTRTEIIVIRTILRSIEKVNGFRIFSDVWNHLRRKSQTWSFDL
jgi:hypothetical protein